MRRTYPVGDVQPAQRLIEVFRALSPGEYAPGYAFDISHAIGTYVKNVILWSRLRAWIGQNMHEILRYPTMVLQRCPLVLV